MGQIIEKDIEAIIYVIRGQKVMIDSDLASLYQVETGALNRQVKRNIERFPEDFMFQLTYEELENLRCQIGISSSYGGRRYLPLAFTEHGIIALSGVLNSQIATQINIEVVRTFIRLRKAVNEIVEIKKDVKRGKELFRIVFERLDILEADLPILKPKRKKISLK